MTIKPPIDECIARAERDVDLAAGWLAADKADTDAQQNYQHCVAVRDFLRAHKRITAALAEKEGGGWMRWKTRPEVDARQIVWLPTIDSKFLGQHRKNKRGLTEVLIYELPPLPKGDE